MNQQVDNITSGPIVRTVFSLALPVVIGMFMEFALSSTDYYWVGKLGTIAQDAVTSSMVVMWTMFASASLISVGITAIVARYVGARDFGRASYFVKQGLTLALVVGLVFSVVGFIVARQLLTFMGTGEATLKIAVPYLRIFFISGVLFFMADTTYAIFRASGDTRTPTKVGVLVVIINLVLDPLLIFGLGPIPAFGVAGASLATAIAIMVGVVVIMARMSGRGLGYDITDFWKIRARVTDMLKIIRISIPITTQQFVFVFVYWFLIKIVHEFGEGAAAAMGIGNRMESFSYLTCYGFSLAASTMVGQNLGARKPDRAARCAWGSVGVAVALTFVISIVFITIPRVIAGVFTNDPQVLNIAVDYLIILGLSQMAMALEIVLEGSFGGAGDTVPPMVVLLPGSAIRIPLAYFLCFHLDWGINGVWWTLTITSGLKAIILALWFKRGKWKLKQV